MVLTTRTLRKNYNNKHSCWIPMRRLDFEVKGHRLDVETVKKHLEN